MSKCLLEYYCLHKKLTAKALAQWPGWRRKALAIRWVAPAIRTTLLTNIRKNAVDLYTSGEIGPYGVYIEPDTTRGFFVEEVMRGRHPKWQFDAPSPTYCLITRRHFRDALRNAEARAKLHHKLKQRRHERWCRTVADGLSQAIYDRCEALLLVVDVLGGTNPKRPARRRSQNRAVK